MAASILFLTFVGYISDKCDPALRFIRKGQLLTGAPVQTSPCTLDWIKHQSEQ